MSYNVEIGVNRPCFRPLRLFFYNCYSISLIKFKRKFDFVNYKIFIRKIQRILVWILAEGWRSGGAEPLRWCKKALGK